MLLSKHEGLISFSVTSEKRMGRECLRGLKESGVLVCNEAKSFLRSPSFRLTAGSNNLVVVKGGLFRDTERTTSGVRAFARENEHKLNDARAEMLVTLLDHHISLRDMGLWTLVAMEPIENTNGGVLLTTGLLDYGGRWLNVWHDDPDYHWNCHVGFVFSTPTPPSSHNHFKHNHPH